MNKMPSVVSISSPSSSLLFTLSRRTISLFLLLSCCCIIHGFVVPVVKKSSSNINKNRIITTKRQVSISTPTPFLQEESFESNVVTEEEKQPKVGVLLLNLGGPEKTEDVEGFLYNLFADPDIIRLGPLSPIQGLVASLISKRRAPKSIAAYNSIGGGSPILKYSQEQATLIEESLSNRYGLDVKTYIGMRYWYPFTEEALKEIQNDNIEALVVLPLYPQFSISTSGSSLRVLAEEFAGPNKHKFGNSKKGIDMIHTVVPSWYERKGYVQAMSNLIRKELESFTELQIKEAKKLNPDSAPLHVLFSAHGVPASYIEAGDPYQKQIIDCVDKISKQVLQDFNNNQDNNGVDVELHLSYQSRVGPIEWLRPYTDDVLPELGIEKNVKNLVVVPISFVSEHIETLEEIDMEYRELAEESGITNWKRCPALNTDPLFINDMADMVIDALNEPLQTITEACIANNVGNIELNVNEEDQSAAVLSSMYSTTANEISNNSVIDFGNARSNAKGAFAITALLSLITILISSQNDGTFL